MSNESIQRIADGIAPLFQSALIDCCKRGSTRTNDGGMVDTALSSMCSKMEEGISNGYLVAWTQNPGSRTDGYINLYTPTDLGRAVCAHILGDTNNVG